MSDPVWPHRWQPTSFPHPWDSLGKNTAVGCHFLLQCMKVKSQSEVAQSCLLSSRVRNYGIQFFFSWWGYTQYLQTVPSKVCLVVLVHASLVFSSQWKILHAKGIAWLRSHKIITCALWWVFYKMNIGDVMGKQLTMLVNFLYGMVVTATSWTKWRTGAGFMGINYGRIWYTLMICS